MIQANHPGFSCTRDMSLVIYGIIFSGPLMHTDTPSGTVLFVMEHHTGKCIRRFDGIYAYCRYFIDRKW